MGAPMPKPSEMLQQYRERFADLYNIAVVDDFKRMTPEDQSEYLFYMMIGLHEGLRRSSDALITLQDLLAGWSIRNSAPHSRH